MEARKSIRNRVLAVIVSVAMIFTMTPAAFMMSASEVNADSGENSKITGKVLGYVYFGSYPQTEIVSKASDSGVHGRPWATKSDYKIDKTLYKQLKSAKNWDKKGDVTIAGNKYHRMKKSDATSVDKVSTKYKWANSTTYHYFKYEPIKWRALENNNGNAFLMAEKALDNQKYNKKCANVKWYTCSLRKWLNSTFLNRAFTTEEKGAILTTTVVNKNSLQHKTSGGKNTKDKIYILSESEVFTDNAVKYGFDSDGDKEDKARQAKSSTYTKAMGTSSEISGEELGNSQLWLRSPGEDNSFAAIVDYNGCVEGICSSVIDDENALRPVLHLDMNKTSLYVKEDRDVEISSKDIILKSSVVYDGTEKKPEVTIKGLTKNTDYKVAYSNNVNLGTAIATVTGAGGCSGTVTKQFRIVSPSFSKSKYVVYKDNRIKLSLNSSVPDEIKFTSSDSEIAAVNREGKVTGIIPGKVTITATADNVNAKCIVKVKKQDVKASKVVLSIGAKKRIKVRGAVGKTSFKSANSKVATVSSKGIVKAKKIGKTYITVKNNGYTMHVKVYVKHYKPRYYTDFDYDDNIKQDHFYVYIHNKGKKSIKVYSYGAKAVYKNKKYNRNLTLAGGNKIIKPGKTKRMYFIVKGNLPKSVEFYDYTVRYYIKCDGKYYKASAEEEVTD